MFKHYSLIIAMIAGTLTFPSRGLAQSMVSPTPIGPIWQVTGTLTELYAGGGLALSPNGKVLVRLGDPEPRRSLDDLPLNARLLLIDLETGKTTVLWPSNTAMYPRDPAFSPDGTHLAFVVHGDTSSYPSDIYGVAADGTGLRQLTQSVERKNPPSYGEPGYSGAIYQKYYGSPQYSPDGSRILLAVTDADRGYLIGMMKADGSDLQILAEGRPFGWSADGKSVYYSQGDSLVRMDLATRKTVTVPRPTSDTVDLHFLGLMKGKPWFAFIGDDGRIRWYDFDNVTPLGMKYIGDWSVPAVKMNGAEEMTLKGFDWSDGSEVLLWYQGQETERFEVVRIANPASLSR